MTTLCKIEQEINSVADSIYDPKTAVFTFNQTKEIIQTNLKMIKPIIDHLNVVECKLDRLDSRVDKIERKLECLEPSKPDDSLRVELRALELRVRKLELESKDFSEEIKKLSLELHCFEERVENALKNQAKEIEKLALKQECLEEDVRKLVLKVKELFCREDYGKVIDELRCLLASMVTRAEFEKLEHKVDYLKKEVDELKCRDYRDKRIENILLRLEILEQKEIYNVDKEIAEIFCRLEKTVTKKELEKVIKRIECLENKRDYNVDEKIARLEAEVHELKKRVSAVEYVNVEQSKKIAYLESVISEFKSEVHCLKKEFERNSVFLLNKIDKVESQQNSINASQEKQIKELQYENQNMRAAIKRLEEAILTKDGCSTNNCKK